MASARRLGANYGTPATYGIGKNYNDFATWEAATDIDLVTDQVSKVLDVDAGSWDDSMAMEMPDAAYSDSTYFRTVRAASGDGHSGIIKTDGTVAHVRASDAWKCIIIKERYAQVQDLVITNSNASFNGGLIYFTTDAIGAAFVGCLCDTDGGSSTEQGVLSDSRTDAGSAFVIDCIIANTVGTGVAGGSGILDVKNTTVDNCGGTWGFSEGSSGTLIAVNCICRNSGSSGDYDSDAALTKCASSDDTGSTGLINLTFDFVNAAGGDYHLDTGSPGIGEGDDLSATGNYEFDDDVDGDTISGDWNCGADWFSSGPTYTLTSAAGTFTLTGAVANLLKNHVLSAGSGSYALSGTDAGLLHGRVLTTSVGVFTLSGTNADLLHDRVLNAGIGSFGLSGTNAGLLYNRVFNVDAGSFILSGTVATLLHDRVLSAETGGFSLAGTEVTFFYGATYILVADAGSYVLSGINADLFHNRVLTAVSGSYVLTGADAELLHGRVLSAGIGSLVLSGTDAGLLHDRVLSVNVGVFNLAGTAASLLRNYVLPADAGSFILTGTDPDLLHNRVLSAGSGSFILSGTDISFVYGIAYILTADSGSFALSGTAADLLHNRVLTADAGLFVLSGTAVVFVSSDVPSGIVTVAFTPSQLIVSFTVTAPKVSSTSLSPGITFTNN